MSHRWAALRAHLPLLLLLAARLALGLAYSQSVPAWESFDEDGHFAYARYLAVHHRLTLPAGDPEATQIWEKFQPPLYYDLIAPLFSLFNLGPSFPGPARNPYFANGDAGINYALHAVAPGPKERALEAALATGRGAGVLITTLSVLPIFWLARRLWPRETASVWLAVVLYAFWPQFLFLGSMLTNDVLITALSALALWLAVDLALSGPRLRLALALGVVVGLSLLTKLNGAASIVLAAGALILSLPPTAGRLRPAGRRWLLLGLSGLAVLVIGAIWVLGSLNFVTGQILQLSVARDFAQNIGTSGQHSSHLILAALAYAFHTFLASYGWGNLEGFQWAYGLWTAGAVLAVAGALLALWRRLRRPPPAPATAPARIYALLAVFSLTVVGLALALGIAQQNIYLVPGRYLLPALPAVCVLLVAGWRCWLPSRPARRWAAQAISFVVVLAGWAVPFTILVPAYARPVLTASVPVDTPVHMVYANIIELLGYNGSVQGTAGQAMQVRLCWRALVPIAANQTLFLEVVGADGQGYGRLRTFAGHGNFPTSLWTAGAEFCERYEVPIAPGIPAPSLAHLRIEWLEGTSSQPLLLRTAAGVAQGDSAYLLEFKVAAAPGVVPAIANPVSYRMGEDIQLSGFEVAQAGSQVRVTLRWQALANVTGNYVVFAHLRDTPTHAYAQGDGVPVQGGYPTRLWQKGEVILDTHLMTLPPGPARPFLALYVGMVDTQTQKRLPVFDASGRAVLNNEIILARDLSFP